MALTEGDQLPDATLLRMGETGPEQVRISELATDRRIVIFGLPGPFTGVCSTAHVPSFIRTYDDFKAKGIDDIVCVAVSDPFVMAAWGEATGAARAGILMLADPASEFTKACGMAFTAPPVGFYDRSKRFAAVVDDRRVVTLHEEDNPGVCDTSGGESLLETL